MFVGQSWIPVANGGSFRRSGGHTGRRYLTHMLGGCCSPASYGQAAHGILPCRRGTKKESRRASTPHRGSYGFLYLFYYMEAQIATVNFRNFVRILSTVPFSLGRRRVFGITTVRRHSAAAVTQRCPFSPAPASPRCLKTQRGAANAAPPGKNISDDLRRRRRAGFEHKDRLSVCFLVCECFDKIHICLINNKTFGGFCYVTVYKMSFDIFVVIPNFNGDFCVSF